MATNILPKKLQNKIKMLYVNSYTPHDIFDVVYEEAAEHVKSERQLSKCITRLIQAEQKNSFKEFDKSKFQSIIDSLSVHTPTLEFENKCMPIAINILADLEKFKKIENANEQTGFSQPPFDLFGFREGIPVAVELKASLRHPGFPNKTKKRRLRELISAVQGLEVSLLQVNLGEGIYRIRYKEESEWLFKSEVIALDPVIKWVKSRMPKSKV